MRGPVPVLGEIDDLGVIGYLHLLVTTPDGDVTDLTMFDGVPTELTEASFADPFGPERLTFDLPGATIYERPGVGRLSFLQPNSAVDLVWSDLPPGHIDPGDIIVRPTGPRWTWEGRVVGISWSTDPARLSVDCQGAMYELDDYLAFPEYPTRPLPYEVAIARQFARHPYSWLHGFTIEWPDWWQTTYSPIPAHPAGANRSAFPLPWQIPEGVVPGQNWTGMVTRDTGSWNKALTGYVQTMLAGMYTRRGQWTLMLNPHRIPVLRHRSNVFKADDTTVVVDVATPGVAVQGMAEDWTQQLSVVYMSGRDLQGTTWSGMAPTGDGRGTSYVPMAHRRQAWPEAVTNPWFQPHQLRREVYIEASDGLEQSQGQTLAEEHLARFASAGMTGSITLTSDPMVAGQPFPRMLLQPGATVQLKGWGGVADGVLAHVAKVDLNFAEQSVSLTLDTRFRDFLTIDQVRNRGRDSLQIVRQLATGKFQNVVPDLLFPWSYDLSGYMPSGNGHYATKVFAGMPDSILFPWEEWTTAHPPSNPAYKPHYMRIGPTSKNASDNWTFASRNDGPKFAYQVRMSQAGSSRLIQLAAFTADGTVMPVGFHVGWYLMSGTSITTMPMLPAENVAQFPPYQAGQRFPFFPYAFEQYNPDGTSRYPSTTSTLQTAGKLLTLGSDSGKAGFWPGEDDGVADPTGLEVQEGPMLTWDCTSQADWDPRKIDGGTGNNPLLGSIYMMIYCDEQLSEEVYFLGRIFRQEPGQG